VAKSALIKCFAKINLHLDVICKRPDGYHNIETIFQTISLCDVIGLELIPSGIELTCTNPGVPLDESNLVSRAFMAMKDASGYEGGVRIDIEKHIPPGSGLGGGSSNAAATLAAMNRMPDFGLPQDILTEIAGGLGADVPFFLTGGLAAAWGIGDKMISLPPPAESFLLVAIPRGISVSTPTAYSMIEAGACGDYNPNNFDDCTENLKSRAHTLGTGRPLHTTVEDEPPLHNSLERPVFARHPEIARLKEAMIEAGAVEAMMSGSGSSVFGLAASESDALDIRKKLQENADCDCFVVSTTELGHQDIKQ
jgi:4-diphosphocytidyl-2-C-methyl-D-erythritol kinase